MDGILRQVTES